MKLIKSLIVVSLFGLVNMSYAADKKEEPKKEPETKTVCVDVQGKDGKPVMDPKTNKPKQNCTKVKVREKFEGTKIDDAKKK